MESFFLAETTKYLYLMFDPDNFIHSTGRSGSVVNTPSGPCILDAGMLIKILIDFYRATLSQHGICYGRYGRVSVCVHHSCCSTKMDLENFVTAAGQATTVSKSIMMTNVTV